MRRSNIAHAFARAVIDRDFRRAYGLTTDGYRRGVSFQDFARQFRDAEGGAPPPLAYVIDGNDLSFGDLVTLSATTGRRLPGDVNVATFVRWTAIAFQPGPDDETGLDACYDFWCLTVREAGAERIAHCEAVPPRRPTPVPAGAAVE